MSKIEKSFLYSEANQCDSESCRGWMLYCVCFRNYRNQCKMFSCIMFGYHGREEICEEKCDVVGFVCVLYTVCGCSYLTLTTKNVHNFNKLPKSSKVLSSCIVGSVGLNAFCSMTHFTD